MILAAMGATWRAVFFIAAILCFLGAAAHPNEKARIPLLGVGLGLFVFVFAWDAVDAA